MLTDSGNIADEQVYTVVGTVQPLISWLGSASAHCMTPTSPPTNGVKLKGQSTMATFLSLAICMSPIIMQTHIRESTTHIRESVDSLICVCIIIEQCVLYKDLCSCIGSELWEEHFVSLLPF